MIYVKFLKTIVDLSLVLKIENMIYIYFKKNNVNV